MTDPCARPEHNGPTSATRGEGGCRASSPIAPMVRRGPGRLTIRGRGARAAGYFVLLLLSTLVRHTRIPGGTRLGDQEVIALPSRGDGSPVDARVLCAFEDLGERAPTAVAVLLLHGSPGRGSVFAAVAPTLTTRFRVVVPDLPGFGASTRDLPDYSVRTHALYVLDLLDRLGIAQIHVVGYSMGGGVALHLAELAPSRVRSLTMLSAIGVQEMELTGTYRANHLLHGAQLAVFWAMVTLIPHFGWLDDSMLGVPYARNFYDSDQRPLRGILQRLRVPVLILHGRDDGLVPFAAAREHHRIVPQSELEALDGGHFVVLSKGPAVARAIAEFVERTERGEAPTRDRASLSRLDDARRPFDTATVPRWHGIAGIVRGGLLVVGAASCAAAAAWLRRSRRIRRGTRRC